MKYAYMVVDALTGDVLQSGSTPSFEALTDRFNVKMHGIRPQFFMGDRLVNIMIYLSAADTKRGKHLSLAFELER